MNPAPPTILVVDDNALTARCVASLLRRLGFGAVLAFHGPEALTRLAHDQFVAVITDVDMPGMTGFELLHNIRLDRPHLPVVFMTASPDPSSRETARASGAWAFVQKPVTFDHLHTLLDPHPHPPRSLEGLHVFRPRPPRLQPNPGTPKPISPPHSPSPPDIAPSANLS